jgi:hypothetical protein
MVKQITLVLFIISSLNLYSAPRGGAMKNPDLTKGEKIPEGAVHDWNLGATGTRGWMYSNKMVTSEARQIAITKVEKDSPADGILKVGDVILGVGGKKFSADPRTEMGKAITSTEAGDGILELIQWRAGKTNSVKLKLPVLGSYSATAPYSCPKSEKILMLGCEALAKRITSGDKRRQHTITRCLNGLALLASGNADYYPTLKKEAQWAKDFKPGRLPSWSYAYVIMFLSEYTMATGDQSFLPDLRLLTLEVANGQSEVGSWGHGLIHENGRLGGYGMMNATGVPLTIGLVLAREAGVKDQVVSEAIHKSAKLLRFYTEKGSVPYGDHHPWIQSHDGNGKCSMAAVLFNLLGEKQPTAFFSKMSLASHGSERDTGHTGNFLNMTWSMQGVAQSGPNATGAWMKEFGSWYFDLARQWDGNFIHQGPPDKGFDRYKHWDCTGAYLLAYAMPLKKIHLTGKNGRAIDAIDKKQAQSIVQDGRGWTVKDKNSAYNSLSKNELIKRLGSWSPVVRERAVMALDAKKMGVELATEMIKLLGSSNVHIRLGACRMLGKMKAASAVEPLRKCLKDERMWLRVNAAEALAEIGKPAMPALPELLEMVAKGSSESDPRAMEQRFLCFAIFDKMLRHSLDGVDRELLSKAIASGLRNDDGRSRSSVGKIYRKMTYDEIKPLLPAIHDAIREPAPSGIMFASGIRLSGIELLAKHRIKEGLPLCFEVIGINEWGKKGRIGRCLNALDQYGGAAKPYLPQMRQLEKALARHRELKMLKGHLTRLQKLIREIESAKDSPDLRSMRN